MQEISVPEMDLHIRKITEGDEQEGKEREIQRDFKNNARDQCSRDGSSYQKDYRRRRAGRERERCNETSRTMQEISVPEMDPSYQKDYRWRRAGKGKRERCNETSRIMQEISVPEMDLHIRKITEGDEQEGKERGTTRLQGQCKRSVFQTWIFIS